MWYVYIIECSNGYYYTGITNDIDKRMDKHAQGIASKFTRGFGFKKLLYREEHATKSDALKREFEIKQLTRLAKKNLIKNRKK